jgi:hypothetical protein
MGFVLLPVLAPTVVKSILLAILWKPRNQVCVAGGDTFLLECFSNFGNELEQSESGVDKTLALPGFLCDGRNIISRQVEKPLEPLEVSTYYTRTVGSWSFFPYHPSLSSVSRTGA